MAESFRGIDRRKAERKEADQRAYAEARQAVEALIDETLDESFPASDPPAWGSVAARVRRMMDGDLS